MHEMGSYLNPFPSPALFYASAISTGVGFSVGILILVQSDRKAPNLRQRLR